MPEDMVNDRLMVSVHYVDNSMYWSNKIGGEEWLKYIDSQCAELKKAFLDNDIPVFMGETTSTYTASNMAKDATHTDSSECLSIVLGKLTELAGSADTSALQDVLKALETRAQSYTSYTGSADGVRANVKFVMKTAGLPEEETTSSSDTEDSEAAPQDKTPDTSFWDRVKNLFS